MQRSRFLAAAAVAALTAPFSAFAQAENAPPTPQASSSSSPQVETVVVTAKRLSEARASIQTQIGASTYAITAQDIQNMPAGNNTLLNQVILQMPSVAQDSFGQFHIRGEHNALQYRLDGVTLPEGISVFGQTLDPRLASSVELLTGALPAEYGLETGGVVNITPKTGLFDQGGVVSMYGGSHNELQPSFDYGGSEGSLNYFVSGDYLTDSLGIESPDGSSNPIHDRTTQYHGFAYLEDILDSDSSITAILGTSHDHFEIPNTAGLTPTLGLTDIDDPYGNGTYYPSADENETQREITHYGILSYLRSQGPWDFQISVFGRYSSLNFAPDQIGDLLYNGIAQSAYKRDVAGGEQSEFAYHLSDDHTIRGGAIIETDLLTSNTSSNVLPEYCTTPSPTLAGGSPANPYTCVPYSSNPQATGPYSTSNPPYNPNYNVPENIIDNSKAEQWEYSFYLQDEWDILSNLTLNYGLRYDRYDAYSEGSQLSPRVNAVWKPLDGTTLHVGYARYFSPPPFELVANETVAKFSPPPVPGATNGTSATPPITQDTTPVAEHANYFDAGAQQRVWDNLLLGIDSYYKLSTDMIDEGQFGAPIILTPFNYRYGKQYGAELTADYTWGNLSAYGNVGVEHAVGKDWITSQFSFTPQQYYYVLDNYIHLDHEQALSASGGASYKWGTTLFDTDLIYGTGLRSDYTYPDGFVIPNGTHVTPYLQVNVGVVEDLSSIFSVPGFTARFDVINLFDREYQIRSGSGVGVFAPQWGPRRGFFVGLSKTL
ncbi:MAG TPA: TonB-dependent receptor [Rhizomicrobium sp.]|nr:TonB-dependent receptor [Rhizomicrobium sp.]